ncbi:bifunctional protein PutA [Arenicella chitinivorans]|uniref:Bifunctional protein PutA n=1 Tax=Arenicella chitinivorans TaxID=1329800 RepID=A0A918VNK4_9GAMM|nr:bifunctional proline dehydrogenase/L-glutamate gamma-semialdehyde dehydrogenase PutA [Arenicella chitinivorans]GHA11541.1 bifunctional protein PutA [Arenicella chitinivorans]
MNTTRTYSSNPSSLTELRTAITQTKHVDEDQFVSGLIAKPSLPGHEREALTAEAQTLVQACREDTRSQTLLDSFLQEFGLSNQEGVALMCLAEALLRVPDSTTADRLIAEKISSGDWRSHSGQSESVFVNAATWGMILTGKLVFLDEEITQQPGSWVKRLTANLSEPVVRRAIHQAMRIMGGQYVLGRSIEEGIRKGTKQNDANTRFSFDMLGEAARTRQDAARYYQSYADSLERVGKLNTQSDVYCADGVSVKLSALHPQYHVSHADTVMRELLPRITELCRKAKHYNIGLSIDAEEAARLELSLDIFEALCRHPDLQNWDGLGFVMQAYQKRAPAVAQWLIALGQTTNRRLMVRLVKGAYWDAEIKHAQEHGLSDYPVFTRKVNTDICYLNCAQHLLGAPGAIYPQFATHNAYTAMAVLKIALHLENTEFEFQRLHGMGELMYKHLRKLTSAKDISLRVYAPIGEHEDLLPYLVRRLLENGANSSFVNRFLDNETPASELVRDIYDEVADRGTYRHSKIPLPVNIFHAAGEPRPNARGLDLDDEPTLTTITAEIEKRAQSPMAAHSIIVGRQRPGTAVRIFNPARVSHVIGESSYASTEDIELALQTAYDYTNTWSSTSPEARAAILNKTAELLETNMLELMAIINLEAGRTIADCVSEVREAVDFCRYYALQATTGSAGHSVARGRGVFFCISPWNFPLAIFIGQLAAALVAGNCVLAKPAEQTPLVAVRAIELLLEAGCPVEAVQLVLGEGAVVGNLVNADPRIQGIAFTGSTETAQRINQVIANRSGPTIPLIAETGGQNCMIVDSTALPEQVVDAVISSAFHSAGQRCSALRVLFVQDVVADKVIGMLEGALHTVTVGSPDQIQSDVGPVIDQRAAATLAKHIDYIAPRAKRHLTVPVSIEVLNTGTYFTPQVFEIDDLSQLTREVFGPVLHIIRYNINELPTVIEQINATGYALTLGVHSRISAMAQYIYRNTHAGNTYINRNIIGAVVGVNPFGGQGLSGTGPKAGGPNYLHRFQSPLLPIQNNLEHKVEELSTGSLDSNNNKQLTSAVTGYRQWAKLDMSARGARLRDALSRNQPQWSEAVSPALDYLCTHSQREIELPGPTGEENILSIHARGVGLILIHGNESLTSLSSITHIVLAAGNSVLLHAESPAGRTLAITLHAALQTSLPDNTLQLMLDAPLTALLHVSHVKFAVCHTTNPVRVAARKELAKRPGPITALVEFDDGVVQTSRLDNYLSYFIAERTKTDNLVARGGNTQLFNLTE